MTRFNFEIHSEARFTRRIEKAKSTRDLLRSTIEKTRNGAYLRDAALSGNHPEGPSSPRIEPVASLSGSAKALVNTAIPGNRQSSYMGFMISTVCPAPWVWVAYFGRADGRPIFWQGAARSVAETAPHQAAILALSDAMLSIEELVAARAAAENSKR